MIWRTQGAEYEVTCPECGYGALIAIEVQDAYLCHGCGTFWANEYLLDLSRPRKKWIRWINPFE